MEVDSDLSKQELDADFKQELNDWIMCLEMVRREHQPPPDTGLTTWFWLWRQWNPPGAVGPEPSGEPRDRPWLLARLRSTYGRTAGWIDQDPSLLSSLVELASTVTVDEPGFLTAHYHRARLLIDLERLGEAESGIDALLSIDGLSLADENRLRDLRSWTATTVHEFLGDTILRPVEVGTWYSGRSALAPVSAEYWNPGDRLPTANAIGFFNRLSPNQLLAVERGEDLPGTLRERLIHTAWTRAVVLKEYDVARRVSRRAVELDTSLSRLLRLSDDDLEAAFEGELTMIRNPQLCPLVTGVFDHRQDRYSCSSASSQLTSRLPVAPIVAELSDQATMAAMVRGFEIGLSVLEWAEHHADDPRVPEALHRLVDSKRAAGDISQAAFQLLHRRYPKSQWATKTPYWFQG
jgi:hypothetical protein